MNVFVSNARDHLWAARAANARAAREIQPGPQSRHARRIRHARAALEAPDNNIAGGPVWSARQRRLNPVGCGRRLRWLIGFALFGPAMPAQDWYRPTGGSTEGGGAAVTIGDVDLDGRKDDVVLLAAESGSRGVTIRYGVGRDLSTLGEPLTPVVVRTATSVFRFAGRPGGAGVALGQFDADPRPDLLVAVLYPKAGDLRLQWRVAFNLAPDGAIASWGPENDMAAGTTASAGAGIAVGDFDGDALPDAVVTWYEDPTSGPGNVYRYRVVFDLDATGRSGGLGPWISVPGQGHDGEGADVAVVDLDDDPRPEIVLMCFDAPVGPNNFRWTIGWNANPLGDCALWTTRQQDVFGHVGEGAGVAFGQWNGDPRPDVLFTALDPGPGGQREWRSRPLTDALGAAIPFGAPCAVARFAPEMDLPEGDLPRAGSALTLRVTAPTGIQPLALLALDTVRAVPPIPLDWLRLPGCALYVQPLVVLPFTRAATHLQLTIPGQDPRYLLTIPYIVQTLVFDTNLPDLPVGPSRGLELRHGSH